MLRALSILLLAGLLGGCATQNYRYYGSDYYSRSGADPSWQAAERGYVDAGYVDHRIGGNYYDYPDWVDSPYYYSLFWSFNRAWVDPFWYPNFYYGVTWYPRNYFSVSYRYFPRSHHYYRYGRPYYAYLSYSPYRYAWVDYYYDWYPWYSHYPHYHYNRYYAPRFGNSRNEAERLAGLGGLTRQERYQRQDGYYSRGWDQSQSRRDVISERQAARGADHYSSSGRRIDPAVSGFERGANPRGANSSREDRRYDSGRRGADYGDSDSRRELRGIAGPNSPRDNRAPLATREPSATSSPRDADRSGVSPSRRDLEAGIPYPDRSTPRYTAPARYGTPREDSYNSRSGYTSRSGVESRSRDANSYSPPREPIRYNPAPAREPEPRYSPPPRAEFNVGRGDDGGRGGGSERSAPRFERSEPTPRFERSEPAPRAEPVERVDHGGSSRSEAGRFREQED